MITTSIDGITADKMHVFWEVMHQIESNLRETSQDEVLLD
jgi:MarR family transcriptional regulator for hemolysin